MKLLITGGNGNISHYCTQQALNLGHDVYILNRGLTSATRRDVPRGVTSLSADLKNPCDTKRALSDHYFDCIIDFLCYDEKDARNAFDLFAGICAHYIFISSVTAYQRITKSLPYTEESKKLESSEYEYAYNKVLAEYFFMEKYSKSGFPVTIVRPAHTYDTIVPVSIGHNCFTAPQRFLEGKPVLIAGDGTNLWTLTHSKDFAAALMGLVTNKDCIGQDFHITSDEWLTWLEITHFLLDALDLNIAESEWIHIPVNRILNMHVPPSSNMSISYLGKAFRGQRMWCDIYDNSKIKKFVPGWEAKTQFQFGIKETITWLYENSVRIRINDQLSQLMDQLADEFSP